jgi:hypothetical protein
MTKQSTSSQVIRTAALIAGILIPTAVSLMAIIEVRAITREAAIYNVICLAPDICAVHANNIWYRIDGVIDMDAITPDGYVFIPEIIVNNPKKEQQDE